MARASQDPEKLQKIIDKLHAELDQRRNIERELAHMASFSEMAPNPIVETDVQGHIYYMNPVATEVFRTLPSDGTAHAIFDGFAEIISALKTESQTHTSRTVVLDGRTFEQRISLLDGGPRVRFYFSDITELKRLEQLKNQFVHMVSHEVRAPLTTLLASLKMLAYNMVGDLTAKQKQVLELSLKTIERLTRLSTDLLDLSKIEAGKMELHRQEVDLKTLILEIMNNFRPLADERGLTLRTNLDLDPLTLSIDRDKIIEVFTNLVNNALKFTEKGFVELSAVQTPEGVRCGVADTGPGIAEEDVLRFFDKFQKVTTKNNSEEKGTGLGLSLSKQLVELHGGTIWVESRLGHGTEIFFTLPKRPSILSNR